jgi:dienelactone hydrolase
MASVLVLWAAGNCGSGTAAGEDLEYLRGEQLIRSYFQAETARLAEACLADVRSLADWQAKRTVYRQQLFEMLGLDPLPPRTELRPQITGRVEHEEFVVEKLHFQSRPGLYVTGNFYVPRQRSGPLPTILYVCGHAQMRRDGVSLGNKTGYQHHGAWFARNGYACLTIDTLQLGEIEGMHHGTYGVRRGDGYQQQWWWLSRGYTPAGVEAWNCIRALDYLETRPEVDPQRIGVTGRSGGGAYSWWIAALDERIKVAVPVAGITDLQNHVVDGCVEGHCDCMYMVNLYRWDYPLVAALVAPRPLLIANTDKDGIFPLDGVVRLHAKVRRIYELYGRGDALGLQISEGPHRDIQELQVAAFHWFNRHLKGENPPIEMAALKLFEPEQLKVFDTLPEDQLNTRIQETFTAAAPQPAVPADASAWSAQRTAWLEALRQKVLRGWPSDPGPLDVRPAFRLQRQGVELAAYDFTSQHQVRLRLYVARPAKQQPWDLMVLNVLDEEEWRQFLSTYRVAFADALRGERPAEPDRDSFERVQGMFTLHNWAMAYVAPRGVGPAAWEPAERRQTQVKRRFYLLGQTLEGMQAWDVVAAAEALQAVAPRGGVPLWIQASRQMAGVALYGSLFVPEVRRLDLHELPRSHYEGPQLLGVLRYLDMPQAVALAAERSQVVLYQADATGWDYPLAVAKALGWGEKRISLRTPAATEK